MTKQNLYGAYLDVHAYILILKKKKHMIKYLYENAKRTKNKYIVTC